jgi:hypothetical protein
MCVPALAAVMRHKPMQDTCLCRERGYRSRACLPGKQGRPITSLGGAFWSLNTARRSAAACSDLDAWASLPFSPSGHPVRGMAWADREDAVEIWPGKGPSRLARPRGERQLGRSHHQPVLQGKYDRDLGGGGGWERGGPPVLWLPVPCVNSVSRLSHRRPRCPSLVFLLHRLAALGLVYTPWA